jgi:23S rRNA pseudouridine1911/1915/1917 synthase
MPNAKSRILTVDPQNGGRRLDVFLAEELRLSRKQARRLIERDSVKVDGRAAAARDKGTQVRVGSTIEIAAYARPEEERAIDAPEMPLVVLASGPGWLAVDKPAGTPVHPLRADETGTLLSAIAARHPEIHGVGEKGLRSGIVHRLDVDTSGAMLFATSEPAWQRLRDAFREHRVEKVYRAIVAGRIDAGEAHVGLVTARHRPAKVRVVNEDEARSARGVRMGFMRWQPVQQFESATLVEARPTTGFLHQIRATFAHFGHPILGDCTYADEAVAAAAPRHMLHAARVRFEEVMAASGDPEDFKSVCARLLRGE